MTDLKHQHPYQLPEHCSITDPHQPPVPHDSTLDHERHGSRNDPVVEVMQEWAQERGCLEDVIVTLCQIRQCTVHLVWRPKWRIWYFINDGEADLIGGMIISTGRPSRTVVIRNNPPHTEVFPP